MNEEIMKYYDRKWKHILQNLCHIAKAKKGKFIAIQGFLKKQEKQKKISNNLICHVEELDKEQS